MGLPAGAKDCLRSGESRVNYALRVCAHVQAFLRANLQSLGQLLFFGFLTQGRISSATLMHPYLMDTLHFVLAMFTLSST